MKSFPIDGYRFYKHGNRIIAVSTYAGRVVRGIATCAEEDTYDEEYGKRLAAARCNYKVAVKRRERAFNKAVEAAANLERAQKQVEKYRSYLWDASNAVIDAGTEVDNIVMERAEI
jgi:hypothetical protein